MLKGISYKFAYDLFEMAPQEIPAAFENMFQFCYVASFNIGTSGG